MSFYPLYHYPLQLKLLYLKSVESLADPVALPGALLLGTDWILGVTWGTSFLGSRLPDGAHNTDILLQK